MTGNTILITGGASGIGRGLAEAFYGLGNTVVIADRNQLALDEAVKANPALHAVRLDLDDPAAIRAFAARMEHEFPALNVAVHSAGILRTEDLTLGRCDDAEEIVTTNLLGPIRLNAALLPLLRRQADSTVLFVSSVLAFVPLAAVPTYCATKAAIHSYAQSLRVQLRDSTTQVVELAPPYVQTHLAGGQQAADARAVPLDAFVREAIAILSAEPDVAEVIVERSRRVRRAVAGPGYDAIFARLNGGYRPRGSGSMIGRAGRMILGRIARRAA